MARRLVAGLSLATSCALLATVLNAQQAVAAQGAGTGRPSVRDNTRTVDGHAMKVRPRRIDPLVAKGRRTPKSAWPASGVADATLAADGSTRAIRAGSLPVRLARPSRDGANRSAATSITDLRVQVLGSKAADAAGVNGVLLTLSPAKGQETTRPGVVDVGLDYERFAHAYGGAFGDRLTFQRLPACVLSTPKKASCRVGTPLRSRNDTEEQRVTATVDLGASASKGDGTSRRAGGRTPVVLAATSGASGPSGDYSASKLSASASWQVSNQSGDFAWSYPMRIPPVPGDLTPTLGIDYSSGSVDGRTANTNNQPSWLGEGFDLAPGFIERKYKSCADDGAPKDQYGNSPADQCWGYANATVSWAGHAGELIKASDGSWRQKDDDGTRFELLTGATNGDDDGEYWRVTTTDGTRYYFGKSRLPGWTSGKPETKSAWTAPVFGNDAGEPCHKSAFADSWCQQAYRWNLDYVVDPHGNAISYWYTQESNYYGRNLKADQETPYVRGGYLDRIEYGQRESTLFSATAPAKVVFTSAERCVASSSFDCDPSKIGANPDKWPDVPWDLHCDDGSECRDAHGTLTPTFWSRKWLAKMTTQILGADGKTYRDVDSWSFGHTWGDADIDRALLLTSIEHTGAAASPTVTLPKVTFSYAQRKNRLDRIGDDIAPFVKYRLSSIADESGGQIDVDYSDPQCSLDDLPTPQTNTQLCFPVYWTPQGFTDPKRDWFHKYVVDAVTQTDRTGGAPDMVTRYDYVGGGAWHYDDDDGLTKEKYKTWSDWRGFGHVTVETGGNTGGMLSRTDDYYLRGMDGDRSGPDGGTKNVSVTDTEGGDHADHDELQGFLLETVNRNGPDGAVVDKTLNTPWSHQTASRTRSWGTTTANLTDVASTHTWTALATGDWRETNKEMTHENTAGLVTMVDDRGDTGTSADNLCTRTTYAQDTAAWMLDYPSRAETVSVGCDSNPDRSTDLVSDVRTYYDGGAFGAAPSKGDATRTDEAASHDGTSPTYVKATASTYDAFGRVTSATDAAGNTTTTGYTDTSGLATQTKVTSPPTVAGDTTTSMVTTTDLDPAWGVPLDEIDPNSKRTDLAYDALGRLRKVWLPNVRMAAGNTPNYEFTYAVTDGQPVAVGERDITPTSGQTVPAYTLYDGLLRPRQTQEPGQNGGRVITDTFYDVRGNVDRTYGDYYATDAPAQTLFGVFGPGDVQAQTAYRYDGVGRKTSERFIEGSSDAAPRWQTTYSYGGDRVSMTPPTGGTPTTTVTDARGRTTELWQYKGTTPSGDHDTTRYTYTGGGQLATVTDQAGNRWTHHYDLRGREVATDDPDTGTTKNTYDDLDRLTSSTDARGQKLFSTYDSLGRKTETRKDSATGTLLASWQYDTLLRGQLTSSTRYVDGNAYVKKINGYNNLYQPLKTTYTIPASEGALAGNYIYGTGYNLDGTPQGFGYPATGDMAAEGLSFSYDSLKQPTRTVSSLASYVSATTYTNLGEVEQLALGASKRVWESYTYESSTRRLINSRVDRENVNGVDRSATYKYDDAGNVTSISDVSRNGNDTQCFGYDYLRRLTEAWAQGTSTCAASPTSGVVGGVAPYWESYGYDVTGNRTKQTIHGVGGAPDTVRNSTYPAAGAAHPHALSSVTTSGSSQATGSYDYDAAGDTTRRPTSNGDQTLSWDAEGNLAKITDGSGANAKDTSFIYDADGTRLIRRAPAATTLYLPGQEVRLAAGATTTTGTRYYTAGAGGATIAVRTASKLSYLDGDGQGTGLLAVDASTQALTQRWFTPFGEPRGPSGGSGGSWPGNRGFVGGTIDGSSGLTQLGAREYDASTGRFMSADPVVDAADPQQMNGYAYANNTPVTDSDPTGLMRVGAGVGGGPGGDDTSNSGHHGGGDGGSSHHGGDSSSSHAQGAAQSSYTKNWWTRATSRVASAFNYSRYIAHAAVTLSRNLAPFAGDTFKEPRGGGSGGPPGEEPAGGVGAGGGCWLCKVFKRVFGRGTAKRPSAPAQPPSRTVGRADPAEKNGGFVNQGTASREKAASNAGDHVLFGKSRGLQEQADKIGARTLMKDAEWQQSVLDVIANPDTKITVSLDGVPGDDVRAQVMKSASIGASGGRRTPFDWEMAQLYANNRLGSVTFRRGGHVVDNPFD